MTPVEFRQLLSTNRDSAGAEFARAKVGDWMNDGEDEVARCLANWMREGLDRGDDDVLLDLAEGAFDGEDGPGHDATD